eukprot:3698993-Pyramimonas_sp.AAC.1
MMTVFCRLSLSPEIAAKSSKRAASRGASSHKFAETTAVSSAYARTKMPGQVAWILSSNSSAQMAYSRGDNGHPCRTPAVRGKPGSVCPWLTIWHRLLSYRCFTKLRADSGNSRWRSMSCKYSCESDGNADAKSKSMMAPESDWSAVAMLAKSTSS